MEASSCKYARGLEVREDLQSGCLSARGGYGSGVGTAVGIGGRVPISKLLGIRGTRKSLAGAALVMADSIKRNLSS